MVIQNVSIAEWSKEYELGIPEIDKQHKMLVDTINEFYTLLRIGQKEEAVEEFLMKLEDYINYHLDYEEKFLEKINYPELESHKKAHELFKKIYKDEVQKIKKSDKKALSELLAFTLSWLYTHIKKTDRKYAEYYFKISGQ